MIREYKISSHNSTVNGYPGREYDWEKFCWDGSEEYDFGDSRYSKDSPFLPEELRGQLIGIQKCVEPYIDDYLISPNCQYLHVPYDYSRGATIFRVRPNNSMCAGEIFRGHLVKRQTAIKKDDGWYWRLEMED